MKKNSTMSTTHYQGDLRCHSTHLKSGKEVITDAPTDNNGKGEAFSPTDLLSTSLAQCVLTIMGIKARALGVNIDGATATVVKVMASGPRRVAEIHLSITLNGSDIDADVRDQLERAGRACPVAKSLHPDLKQEISFEWES